MTDGTTERRRQLGIPRNAAATFGSRARVVRETRGRSQESVASRMRDIGHAGWMQTTLSKVETGQRPVTLEEAYDLAIVLGQHLRDFLEEGPAELQRTYDIALARLSESALAREQAETRFRAAEQEIAQICDAIESGGTDG